MNGTSPTLAAIEKYKLPYVAGALALAGGILGLFFAHAFQVHPDALKEAFHHFTVKGLILNALPSIALGVGSVWLYRRFADVREIVDGPCKWMFVAAQIIGLIAIVTFLLPNPQFGADMLIGGVVAGNILAALINKKLEPAKSRGYGQGAPPGTDGFNKANESLGDAAVLAKPQDT